MHSTESTTTAIVSVRPVTIPAPAGRGVDLQVRVTAPVTGRDLPVILFSHGFGQSMDAYQPLAEHWAGHGFVVVQPTHLDFPPLGVGPDDSRTPEIWRFRVQDMVLALNHLDLLEASVPGLAGRIDRSRVIAAGHSYGGQTAGMLLGARIVGSDEDLSDARVTAGVLLTTAGTGGDDLTPFAAEHFPFMSPDFSTMTTPALVIAGDQDRSPLTVRDPDWFADPYHLSPGSKTLLTIFGAEHTLGGIVGANHTQTTDEDPQRVALVQRVTTAYLRGELTGEHVGDLGKLESR
ncbi:MULTISPECIES: alpha/beta fold hydrolase [Actinoplanes]|uniref:alpha/beta hydrolase family protein n=1 Tax=Actinoplanes TaxID=1865 RepID=UPI0005F2A170|nr:MULTISPECIES: alpha/beta fold hydrolase [Actinoplanes]GLY03805.1 hypothetical protein Acsp01_41840 [Actinoplanes sp. NBRC 101535]